MGIGFTEGLLIAAIAMLLFGGKKIPQLGKTLGESIRGFKEGMKHVPQDSADEIENQNDDKNNQKKS
jgi:sec-independent protein translocase protein TatA